MLKIILIDGSLVSKDWEEFLKFTLERRCPKQEKNSKDYDTDQFKKTAKQLNLILRFCLNVNYGHCHTCHTDCEECPKMSHSYSASCTVAFWSSPSVRFVHSTVQYVIGH